MQNRKKVITIGIPCYNEQENVEFAYKEVKKIISKITKYSFQFLFTDNGSLDKTREKIKKIAINNKDVSGVFLSRNFGFEASIKALMDCAKGDALIILPCDLQDPPELIPKFIKEWENGSNIVAGKYNNTEDDIFTAFLRKAFYFIFKKISDLDIPVNASEVAFLDKKTLDTIRNLPEKFRFFRGLRVWVGFKSSFISYHRRKRMRGKSAYNFVSYFKYAERGIYGFSYLLLDFMMYGTLFLTCFSFLFLGCYTLFHIVFRQPFEVLSTVLVFMFFFLNVQLFGMGVLGKYIQVIVEETKGRPIYIIEEKIGKYRK